MFALNYVFVYTTSGQCQPDVLIISKILGKLSNRKSNETWELVQSGDDNPPPSGVGTFLNLGLYLNGLTPPLKSTWDFFELGIF